MAAARKTCLSPIDAELSIEKRMSSLSTACSWMFVVKFVFVTGSPGTTGRLRHPVTKVPPVMDARTSPARAQRTKLECIAISREVEAVPQSRWPTEGRTVIQKTFFVKEES
jgi:hypothetical protein